MFTPKTYNTRSNFSPFTPGKGIHNSPRTRTTPKRPSSIRKSQFTPRLETGGNVSIHSEEISAHRLELYGNALPVLVTEAITLCNKITDLSFKLDRSGWAWLVWGRKLLLWKYKINQIGKGCLCKELILPASDHPFTADLVTVLPYNGDSNMVACVAVSPCGNVRYWSTAAHQNSYADISTDLKGSSQCMVVLATELFSCLVATSTSTLILVTPSVGQNVVSSRLLRIPQGMLSGLGSRMSSLLFGSVASQVYDAKLYGMAVGELMDANTQAFYVLAGSQIQKWALQGNVENMLYQFGVEKMFADCIGNMVWGQDSIKLSQLRVWLLDIQPVQDGVIILGAALNPDVSNDIHFGLGSLHSEGTDPPQSFISFTSPKFTTSYSEEEGIPHYRLLLTDRTAVSAYVHESHAILCMSVSSQSQPVDQVEFHTPGDCLLGGGSSSDGRAVFFSTKHGLITMKGTGIGSNLSLNETATEQTISKMDTTAGLRDASHLMEMSMSDDKTKRLKAAFIQSCRKNMNEAQVMVDELVPPSSRPSAQPDSTLDSIVTNLSQEMIDDYPASDPRWAESAPNTGGSAGSLILQHQLEDKLKAHEVFVQFLKNVGLWDKLSLTTVRDGCMPTRLLLCEHAEKIVATKKLRELHAHYQPLVDTSIKCALEQRDDPPPGLTPHDVFYREVSRIDELLPQLLDYEEQMLHGQMTPRDVISLMSACNHIIIACVEEACQYRRSHMHLYGSLAQYVPWTAGVGVRPLLHKQYELTRKEALHETRDVMERGSLYQQLLELADQVLNGYTQQLECGGGSAEERAQQQKQYQQCRSSIISPFLQDEQYERAAALAEKYCDFGVLVQLCESTANHDRLHRYMNQFQTRGFAEFVFRWYVDRGQRSRLMTSSLASHPQLARFLALDDNKFMSWLHDIHANDFAKAHHTLQELAMDETHYLAKKKTMLSMSKLCAMSADEPADEVMTSVDRIDNELDLICHQEQLPGSVIKCMGEEADSMHVLSTKELIEKYVCNENIDANEFDFKKALDLLQYLDRSDTKLDYNAVLLHIWCQAILRDDWAAISTDDPIENIKDTIFFKTVELAYTGGMNLQDYLPTVSVLLDALGTDGQNTNLQFLVKAGYEQVQRIVG